MTTTAAKKAPDRTKARFELREALPSDRGYLIKTWIATAKKTLIYRALGAPGFEDFVRAYVTPLLDTCPVLVANVRGEDPGWIVGYAVTGTNIVHFVHVHRDFQRMGLATWLLEPYLAMSSPVIYTHKPTDGEMVKVIPDNWVYKWSEALRVLTANDNGAKHADTP